MSVSVVVYGHMQRDVALTSIAFNGLIAERTFDRRADALAALGCIQDPGADLPGRAVTHVLGMPAAQLGDPFSRLVSMKAVDLPLHAEGLRQQLAVRKLS